MIKNLLVLFTILLSPYFLVAQSRGAKVKIKGQIIDADQGTPLEYATISILNNIDSSLISGGITDLDGNFSIDVKPGSFIVKIEFISYQNLYLPDLKIEKGEKLKDLGQIGLSQNAAVLEEIEVVAEKSSMQMSLDKRIFNVGKDLSSQGGSAIDVLNNVPSVQVDVEGNVNLRGNGNVRILIDGKPSGLVGNGNSDGLRNIPTDLIERIEVITNPSARYQAEGMTGIINIVLKKERRYGLNGSFDFSTGYPHNHGAAINLNYRREKVNLFVNYGLYYRRRPGESMLYQEIYNGDTTNYLDEIREFERGGWSNNIRLGTDIFLTPKSTITTSFNYRISDENNISTLTYLDYIDDYPSNLVSITHREDLEKEDEQDLQFSINYKKDFDNKKQKLTADIQYELSEETEDANQQEVKNDANDNPLGIAPLLQRSLNKENFYRLLTRIDYIHPVGEHGQFETGYQGTFRTINNDFLVEEFDDTQWNMLPGFTNEFLYQENIYGAYLIYGNKIDKISYQVGLRGEYSDVRTELKQTGEINDNPYFNLFPSAFLTYEFDSKNSIQASYSRRIQRPSFRALNPFFSFSNPRNFFSGNPDLLPEFTDSYELGYLRYLEKGSVNAAVYYRYTTGVVSRIRTLNSDGTTIFRPENLLTENAYGLEFNFNYSPYKWWQMNGDVNFFRAITDGANIEEDINSDALTWFARYNNQFTLPKLVDCQVRINYRAGQETPQGRRKSITSIDLALGRDIFRGNGTLTFSVRDLFNTRRYRYSNEGPNFFSEGLYRRQFRQFTLSLNYRLNQKKKRQRGGDRGGYPGGEGGGF